MKGSTSPKLTSIYMNCEPHDPTGSCFKYKLPDAILNYDAIFDLQLNMKKKINSTTEFTALTVRQNISENYSLLLAYIQTGS